MKNHQKNCLGNQPICCSICNATFGDSLQLIDHIEAQHKPENKFKLVHEFKEASQNDDDHLRMSWVANELVCDGERFYMECVREPPEWFLWWEKHI